MPKHVTPLNDTQIRNAKPKDKDYTLTDGDGLALLIKDNGSKLWRFRYTFDGKRYMAGFGVYPIVSLAMAREKRTVYQQNISNGINPTEQKQKDKQAKIEEAKQLENTFEALFNLWLNDKASTIAETTYTKIKRTFERYFIPTLGQKLITDISTQEYKTLILKMSDSGKKSYAYKAKGMLQNFLNYLDEKDIMSAPSLKMTNTLPKPKQTNYPHITNTKELGQLLRAIDDYQGDVSTKYALMLAPFVFVRPANIRFMEWTEIDFAKATWRIPAEKMKARAPHIVPLCWQAIAILQEVKKFNGDYQYVFVSPISTLKTLSENTLNYALIRLGYKDRMVSHGFRHTASTILHEHISEHGFHGEVIERQLAHAEQNGVKAAYNHAEYLDERKELMQWWGDYLSKIKIS